LRKFLIGCAALFCVTAASVAAQQVEPKRKTVVHDPAFTAAQAGRGAGVYAAHCASCHLPGLDGSANPTANAKGAPLLGPRFVQDFGEQNVGALFNKMKRDMPAGNAGSLSDQEYLDIAAYVLQQNKFPAGPADLTVDAATEVFIPGAGGAEGLVDYTYVSGVGCLSQDPTRSWLLTRAQELKKTDMAAPAPAAAAASGDASGEYTFRLLNAYNYSAEPHNGQKVRVSGYLVRLGAEIRVNVQALQPVGVSCDGAAVPADRVAPVTAQPVQPQPITTAPPPQTQAGIPTVWSGVYSEAQAYSGEKVADTVCLGCHGAGLAGGDSGPKLVGADFLSEWNARSAGELFGLISETMPGDAPGTLKKEDVASVVAYILKVNNMPAGRQALSTEREALAPIKILAAKPTAQP
jgi:mono/diheme cytochrome c family protein